MSYCNYISLFYKKDNKKLKIVKNYNYEGHPLKNSPYGLRFQDTTFDGLAMSVKIRSSESRIYYVFSNKSFKTIKFKLEKWQSSEDSEKKQLFKFIAMKGLEIIFLERQYLPEGKAFSYHKSNECLGEYIPIDFKENRVDEKIFTNVNYLPINQDFMYSTGSGKISSIDNNNRDDKKHLTANCPFSDIMNPPTTSKLINTDLVPIDSGEVVTGSERNGHQTDFAGILPPLME